MCFRRVFEWVSPQDDDIGERSALTGHSLFDFWQDNFDGDGKDDLRNSVGGDDVVTHALILNDAESPLPLCAHDSCSTERDGNILR